MIGANRAGHAASHKKNLRGNFTSHEVIEQFKNAMLNAGFIAPDDIIADGTLHRFGAKKSGWYTLYLNGKPAGAFGDWKTGSSQKWKMDGATCYLSAEDKRDIAAKLAERKRQEQAAHAAAAQRAINLWRSLKPAPGNHPYLLKKRIKPHIARITADGRLVLPAFSDGFSQLTSLQFIHPDGSKRFLTGGIVSGSYSELKGTRATVLICEGYATGATLNEHTGGEVYISYSAGNLLPVAQKVRWNNPHDRIIIAGDNDLSGTGLKYAKAAAAAVGGLYLIPPIVGDFNDYVNSGGIIR